MHKDAVTASEHKASYYECEREKKLIPIFNKKRPSNKPIPKLHLAFLLRWDFS